MKPVIIISTVFVFLSISLGIDNAYGYHEFVSLTTDKEKYSMGESITVTIVSDWDYEDYLVHLDFYKISNSNERYTIELLHHGKISTHTMSTPIASWDGLVPAGNYGTSVVFWDHLYKTMDEEKKNTFSGSSVVFEGNAKSVNEKFREKYGQEIDYQIIGGTVTYLGLQPDLDTLVLEIDQNKDGRITIALPRNLIDANLGGEDIPFNVSLPNRDSGNFIPKYTEKSNYEYRILTIELPQKKYDGEGLLWIQGTEMNLNTNSKTSLNQEDKNNITSDTISVQGSRDLIGYDITGGKILNVVPDVDANSLIISIDAIDDGLLTIVTPRSILDATINGEDDEFFVLIDGEQIIYDEQKASKGITYSGRTITIPFSADAEEIEIIGTFVIPEFGSIAMLILVLSVISVVIISRRFNVIRF